MMVMMVGKRQERFAFLALVSVLLCTSRSWIVPDGGDDQDDEHQAEGLPIADEDAQLVRKETELVLHRVSGSGCICGRGTA